MSNYLLPAKQMLFVIASVITGILSSNVYAGDKNISITAQSSIIKPNSSSRQKIFIWDKFTATDAGSEEATEIIDFKVTITEQTAPDGQLKTKYLASWKYHNFTEDDKHKTGLGLTIEFYNMAGQRLDYFGGTSPRDHCTYDPYYQSAEIAEQLAKNNYFDIIDRARLTWRYSASYEGKC